MDATYTAPFASRRTATGSARTTIASLASLVFEVLMQGVRGDDFERAFTSAPGAQFAALPDGSKQRLLDRGYRP